MRITYNEANENTIVYEIVYGWCQYELDNCPYHSDEYFEGTPEDTLKELIDELNNTYLGGEKQCKLYWRILNSWTGKYSDKKNEHLVMISGRAF